jgi:glucosamine-6-phosphate deaminase
VTTEVFQSEDALAKALAKRVASAIRAHPDIVLGLPSGRTPIALYAELVTVTRESGLDWSRVRTFNLDEFVGLGDHSPGSYRRFMHDRLFKHVNITASQIGFLDGHARDLQAECERYDRAIESVGGLDLLILGIGANGHIGFNEPAETLAARTHRVVLEDESRAGNALWFDGDVAQVPREALSMGMATILNAREIVLVATGEGKADAVRAMLEGGVTTRMPASFLQLHPRTTVMLDEAAAMPSSFTNHLS